MALPLAASKRHALALRILSAAILAPLGVFAAWRGGPVLAGVTTLAAAVMGWEWGRLTGHGRFGAAGMLVAATELAGASLAGLGWPTAGIGALVAGAAARLIWPTGEARANLWASIGTLWIGVPCVAVLWLASDPAWGRATVLWVFALVWATDSAAYIVGRWAGGPRLAPRWSPGKPGPAPSAGLRRRRSSGPLQRIYWAFPCFHRYPGPAWGCRLRRSSETSRNPRPSAVSASRTPAASFRDTAACWTGSTACWRR